MGSKSAKKRKQQRKRRQKRVFAWVSCLLMTALAVMLCAVIFGSHSDISAQPSDIVDEGMLRVFLRTLSGKPALGLTLDGVYTVDGDAGFRFARGTEVSIASEEGVLYLSAGGLTIDMGSSFTLKRHAPKEDESAGGIYIHESEKDNLFMGDLALVSTGGGIDCTLSIQIEDYLYGVVAYEMSNSFPLEALKAQAIAARTYAMRARNANKSKAYDVVDTTADQVFKGYDASLANVIKAVDETRGIVGMAGSSFAQCYYTASNGGQIASTRQIWGGTVSYSQMKDDPYDLENSQSTVKRASIPAKPGADNPLAAALANQAKLHFPEAQEIRIDSINAVTLTEPDIDGSLMYKAALFEVSVSKRILEKQEPEPSAAAEADSAPSETAEVMTESTSLPDNTQVPSVSPEPTPGQSASPVPEDSAAPALTEDALSETATPEPQEIWVLSDYISVEEPVTVRLETYGYLKNLLKLNINSQSYEVFSLEEDQDGFTLTARRFGHGVGMSQRGAQTMASKHHKDCEEILSFYYPGVSWFEINWKEHKLTSLDDLPAGLGYARAKPTPRPTQAPLRALKGDEYYAYVTATTLNVRSGPSTSDAIKALLYINDRVIVTGSYPDNWVSIETAEFDGFVKADYLKNTR